jgi:predicted DNA-binding protein with PD1-like motif
MVVLLEHAHVALAAPCYDDESIAGHVLNTYVKVSERKTMELNLREFHA